MVKGKLERKGKYSIPYSTQIRGGEDRIAIVVNGFGGSKESPGAIGIMEGLYEGGLGTATLDLPGHGENSENGRLLRIDNCIEDLHDLELFIRETYPEAEVCYYSISFGAYITLLYLTKYKNAGAKVFICSGAVNMPEFYQDLSDEQEKLLADQGYIWEDDGDKPLMITTEFIEDFNANDLTEKFRDADLENVKIRMIHGDQDEEVDYDKAVAFAKGFNIDLITIHGGDHRMTVPGSSETAMAEALKFFNED